MILPIKKNPDPILSQVGLKLSKNEIFHPDRQQLIQNMIATMYAKDGVGLAASQVGQCLQICVIAKNFTNEQKQDLVLINPSFVKASVFKEWDEEGCLSVPNAYGQVKRYKKIKVKALDINGQNIQFTAQNFFARVIQHEIDHLNGILFITKAKNLHEIYKE